MLMHTTSPAKAHSLIAFHGSKTAPDSPFNDSLGLRKANLGQGLYLSTDEQFAAKYGHVRRFLVNANLLDHDNLSDAERNKINQYISDAIPAERLAGYCELKYRDFDLKAPSERAEAIKLYDDLLVKTSGYYHDRAKVRMESLPNNMVRIQWRDPGDVMSEHPYRLWALFNEFNLDPVAYFGYDGVKCDHEISIRSHRFITELDVECEVVEIPSPIRFSPR